MKNYTTEISFVGEFGYFTYRARYSFTSKMLNGREVFVSYNDVVWC